MVRILLTKKVAQLQRNLIVSERMDNEELFDVVDENDAIIKTGLQKHELHTNDDITRVITLYLFNKNGRITIVQRSANKSVDPLKFESSCCGRVSSGETYEQKVRREAQEELSIDLKNLIEVAHWYVAFDSNAGIRQHFKTLYIGFTDDDIVCAEDEISDFKEFESFDAYRQYYAENQDQFSRAVAFDVQKLDKFFANLENQKLINKILE